MMQRLGDYIRPVDVRNKDLKVERLLGLTIDKAFIPSVANTIGTDLSNYKVICENQFACSLMQVSRDGKMPVAMLKGEPGIMSPAYPMFEVSKTDELLPDYLMMWFSRSEFDREASFYAVGGVRGSLEWDDFCDMKIPVPDIKEQRNIVAEYKTLQTRIDTNKKLIATLEQTAQTLYRHTFVDNIDLGNLPEGWRIGTLGEIAEFANGKLTELTPNGEYPVYGGNGIVGKTNSFNGENIIVIGRVGINCGCLYLEPNKCWINDNAIKGIPSGVPIQFLYWHMRNLNLNAQSEGSSQPLITQGILNNQECLLPPSNDIELFAGRVETVMRACRLKQQENQTLTQMQTLLLSKMGA